MQKIKLFGLALGMLAAFTGQVFSQTNLQFTAVKATDEGAIQLYWSSQSNHLYEIDEADSLNPDTNTGTITWHQLYDQLPSQGTNTFYGDFGNYLVMPNILHPKNVPMRFYRIVDLGADDLTNDEPTISIVSPTNGFVATGNLTITVSPNTDQTGPVTTKLYVDGQEMWPSEDGSNYVINTCEWGNGTHVLFATVECLSSPEGPLGTSAALAGHGVSAFVPVAFSNLVTRISFSQPFFEPSLGQTQQVSAVFAANSDWTLQIKNNNGNVVRTVTGSGTNMVFNWDGNGEGGTNLPAGVYHYYVSAQTNGLAPQNLLGGSSSLAIASRNNVTELWATPVNGGDAAPLKISPPEFDTNNLIIFPASDSEMENALFSSEDSFEISGFSPDDAITPPSQNGPPAPLRPPTTPMDNPIGTFGVAFQNYAANGLAGYRPQLPLGSQGPNIGQITMETYTAGNMPPFTPLHNATSAANFAFEMFKGSWHQGFYYANDQLTIGALRSSGSGNPFNQVDIGLLALHGTYGASMDFDASGCKQMYFPITSGTSSQYIRMSEMNFGGSAPGVGLKWMALLACSSLHQVNWQSMQDQNIKPYNSNLHMILGADTEFELDENISQFWADYMLGDPNAKPTPRLPMPIREAWYQAASDAYHFPTNQFHIISPMKFATVYDNNCVGDYLQTQTNTVLSGSWGKDTSQVWP
ncbi:MAG TPA: DUF6345 domain-containing protein [Verrucomicrobiae bacterium]|nr:DUF6345 domain-containing protein [Verrucomicrobiae bacterium]